jgi:hypothetical protein
MAPRSISERRLTAEMIPIDTPAVSHSVAAPAIRKSVRGARARMRCNTDAWPAKV